jgi:ribosomal protein S18 acetylase RimI-like enzyme
MAGAPEQDRSVCGPNAGCRALEWDSKFFGCRIARLECQLTTETMQSAASWCWRNRVDCLYLTIPCNDAEAVKVAEANRCQLVDIRLSFERPLVDMPPPQRSVRPFRESDIPTLVDIAASSHFQSRFYYDSRFPRERCDELYRVWIERSCRGWADAVFIAENDETPAGYVSCHLEANATGSIGLMAVAAESRGSGLGRHLVNAALQFFRENGRTRATVVTQGRNLASQRLYQRCGFVTESALLYYHRWFFNFSEDSA